MGSVEAVLSASEMEVKVEQNSIELISPSKPTPTGTLFLSNIDLACVFPVETVYFFNQEGDNSYLKPADEMVDKMRKSLADVLVPYHYMAGRLQFNPKDGRIELDYNRCGVLFARATCPLSLAELGDLSFPNAAFRSLVVKVDEYKELTKTPLMTMQVTRFKCGGFCLGFVIFHCLMDGQSAAEFLHNLASIFKGHSLITHPNFLRTSLQARSPPQINYPHHEFIKLNELPLTTSFTTSTTQTNLAIKFQQNQFYKAFTFSEQMIGWLKRKTMKDNLVSKCSTFEAMVAHLWQVRTKAVFKDPKQTSTVLFAVNIRSKVVPPLPKGFVGNGILTAHATASVQDLNEKPLSFCVAEIQKAIDRVTREYVRSAIDWLEINKGIPAAINGNFYLSAWWKLPFHEVDFGWGKSIYGGPIPNGMDEFVLLLSNGRQGVNVWLTLETSQMEKFERHFMDI